MSIPDKFELPSIATPTNRTYWVVNHKLLAGAYPGNADPAKHHQRLQALYEAGLRTFINLQEENETNNKSEPFVRYDNGLRQLARDQNDFITHLRFPIPDGGIPTIDRMRTILDAIDLSLASGRPVYVHCFGGMGRTGTTVCCWLLRHNLAQRDGVIETLTQLRQADKDRADWKAPENADQESFVLNWSET